MWEIKGPRVVFVHLPSTPEEVPHTRGSANPKSLGVSLTCGDACQVGCAARCLSRPPRPSVLHLRTLARRSVKTIASTPPFVPSVRGRMEGTPVRWWCGGMIIEWYVRRTCRRLSDRRNPSVVLYTVVFLRPGRRYYLRLHTCRDGCRSFLSFAWAVRGS